MARQLVGAVEANVCINYVSRKSPEVLVINIFFLPALLLEQSQLGSGCVRVYAGRGECGGQKCANKSWKCGSREDQD